MTRGAASSAQLRTLTLALVWLASASTFTQAPAVNVLPSLMPIPALVRAGAGRVAIDASMRVALTGATDDRLRAAVDRLIVRLQGRTGFVLNRDSGGLGGGRDARRHL